MQSAVMVGLKQEGFATVINLRFGLLRRFLLPIIAWTLIQLAVVAGEIVSSVGAYTLEVDIQSAHIQSVSTMC